ncbi:hypothetical protein ABS71_14440 [bacterium SCN 62-11]|nr:hypothetical protein [Candidatus Eremiobacteraeota bacterium]ODT63355.1 MAG: hypothetical protein ABS71_14440 [bacterium SCN 62-11]
MSAVYASPAQYRCSCGRTFMNGISLERHQWVTKCAPAAENTNHVMLPDQQARATQAAMAQAMRVLKEKQAAQQRFDQKRRSKRRLRRQFSDAQESLLRTAESFMTRVFSLGRVAAILVVLGATFAAGMKLGTFFPV